MDKATTEAFFDELGKMAGVGVDVHGYYRKPENSKLEKAEKDYDARFVKEVGWQPPWKQKWAFLPGADPPPEIVAWRQKRDAWASRNPLPPDRFEYEMKSRVKTPFDRASSRGYKVHDRVLAGSKPFYKMYTDKAYSDKPHVVNLNRGDLKKLKSEYGRLRTKEYPEEEEAFLNKIDHLIKDKRVRFARVEYE